MENSDKIMNDRIQIIIRQTDYTLLEAKEKMQLFDNDHIKVIKSFMGIVEKKAPPIKSVNQEIYKQLRHKLDDSMREYNSKQESKLTDEIQNP
jgi:hypothetical protein